MDLHKMIVELQAERQRLDEAIEALERLSTSPAPRRGRPPRWLKEMGTQTDESETREDKGIEKKPS